MKGKSNYEAVTNAWNADTDNYGNHKHFNVKTTYDAGGAKTTGSGDLDELKTNIDVAIKASLYYWQLRNLNTYASTGDIADNDDNDIDRVGKVINSGSATGTAPNGFVERRTFTKNAFTILNQL